MAVIAEQLEKMQEILQIMEEDFVKDFSFYDIQYRLLQTKFFTETECDDVMQYANEVTQIEKMIFIIIYKEKHIQTFVELLKDYYNWLYEKFYIKLQEGKVNTRINMYRDAILGSDIPENGEFNIHRLKYLYEIQSKLKSLRKDQCLIVHSKLGLGKRWLVSDACRYFSVVKSMNFNLFYINVSKCTTPELILEKLEKLRILLYHRNNCDMKYYALSTNVENELVNLTLHLRKFIEEHYRDCLIILAHVRSKCVMKAFDLHCKMVVITRDLTMVERIQKDKRIEVFVRNGFEDDESEAILKRSINKKKPLPPEAHDIHKKCNGSPFIMALIAKNFAELEPTEQRWKDWLHALNNYQLNEDYLYPIQESLKCLLPEHQELFKSLVIFMDNIYIPIKVLSRYWKKSERDTEDIVMKFGKSALLEVKRENEGMVCSIHYLYYAHLTNELDKNTQRTFHKQFLNSYSIDDLLQNRTEISLFPDDGYFHYYIGRHLKEAGMEELFPKLFLDFGFLEEKIRFTWLPNTIGDLNLYDKEIIGDDSVDGDYRSNLLEEIMEFLPNVEETLIKSQNTCLLQYALTTKGLVGEEAQLQAKKFEHRVWFKDLDHSHKQRQIVQIPKKPIHVKFHDPNSALITLVDADIILMDLSSLYSVEPTLYKGHSENILCIQPFETNHFISLDEKGFLKVWTLNNTAVSKRRYSGDFFEKSGARQKSLPSAGKCIQTLSAITSKDKFQCFCIMKENLIVGSKEGIISTFEWKNSKFEKKLSNIKSNSKNIYLMTPVFKHNVMIISDDNHNEDCNITMCNMITTSPSRINMEWSFGKCLNAYYTGENVVFIFKDNVVQVVSEDKLLLPYILYQVPNKEHEITCSAISSDFNYVILGTKRGILVYSRKDRMDVLHSNVSERIVGVDICSLDDETYKYVLISSSTKAGNVINMYSLMMPSNGGLVWASDKMGSPINSNMDLRDPRELNTWLVGGQLFEVDFNDQLLTIAAMDSKNQLNLYDYSQRKEDFQPLIKGKKLIGVKVNKFVKFGSDYLLGCQDGYLIRVQTDQDVTIAVVKITRLARPIMFMKMVTNDILVVGTDREHKIFKLNETADELFSNVTEVADAYAINGHTLVTIFNDCSYKIIDLSTDREECKKADAGLNYGASTLDSNYLIIGTNLITPQKSQGGVDISGAIYCYKIEFSDNNVNLTFHHYECKYSPIKSICLSADSTLIAVGLLNGGIQISNLEKREFLKELDAHTSPVLFLQFSPWTVTTILVSLSDQIVFSNITYVLNNENNELKPNSPIRTSQRFNKNKRNRNLTPVKNPVLLVEDKNNAWSGKMGPQDNPELLSCIKFVGTSAEKLITINNFSEFITIDDEGNIYYLRLMDKLLQRKKDEVI